MTLAPVITTDRLVLRKPLPADVDAFMAFYGTDRARYVGGVKTPRQAWEFFCTELGHWEIRGYGMFTLTRKGSEAAMGIVGHWDPWGWPEKEVGWVLFDPADEGHGFASEAARACIDYTWRVLEWPTIVSYIAHQNAASIQMAERLGARLDPDAPQPYPDKPCLVYRHPEPEDLS